jgi:teichuronic acid biosynthesis glycosyltransferase TuaG
LVAPNNQNDMSELVSIIMPAYNAAKYIGAAIESIFAQTYSNWELLIIDDGSFDQTATIGKYYQQQDARIRYTYQVNARQARARNNGLKQAKGQYVAFLDADDLWLPDKLQLQVAALLHEPETDLVFADAYVFDKTFDLATQTYRVLGAGQGILKGEAGLQAMLAFNLIPLSTVMCKLTAVLSVDGFTENKLIPNAEDYHLWLRLLLAGRTLKGMALPLAAYREHEDSVSNADRQCLEHVVEAKANLADSFPEQRKALQGSLRKNIRDSLDVVATYEQEAFFTTATRYLALSGRGAWQPLFALWQRGGQHRLAVRSLYFIINYL